MKRAFFLTITTGIGLAIGICLLELLVRFGPLDIRTQFGIGPVYAEFHQNVRKNDFGFRDRSYQRRELDDPFLIIAIGDSYTFGSSIEDIEKRYTNLLQRRLGVPVLNFGWPGFNSRKHQWVWDSAKKHLKPAIVIIQYTLNDPGDVVPCPCPSGWNLPSVPTRLRKASYFLAALNNAWTSLLVRHGVLPTYEDYLQCIYAHDAYEVFLEHYKAFLESIKNEGPELVLMPWPHYTTSNPYPFEKVHQDLKEVSDEIGALYVDLLKSSKEIGMSKLAINANDPHPNEAAHAMAAQLLEKTLLEAHKFPAALKQDRSSTKR